MGLAFSLASAPSSLAKLFVAPSLIITPARRPSRSKTSAISATPTMDLRFCGQDSPALNCDEKRLGTAAMTHLGIVFHSLGFVQRRRRLMLAAIASVLHGRVALSALFFNFVFVFFLLNAGQIPILFQNFSTFASSADPRAKTSKITLTAFDIAHVSFDAENSLFLVSRIRTMVHDSRLPSVDQFDDRGRGSDDR
eukprot:scaffold7349_cov383-Pinguiococcus_pyrenoidosus.AAC.2